MKLNSFKLDFLFSKNEKVKMLVGALIFLLGTLHPQETLGKTTFADCGECNEF